jgi:hypothetical protein
MKSRPAIEGNRQHNDNLNSRVNKSRDTKKETFKIGFSYRLVGRRNDAHDSGPRSVAGAGRRPGVLEMEGEKGEPK